MTDFNNGRYESCSGLKSMEATLDDERAEFDKKLTAAEATARSSFPIKLTATFTISGDSLIAFIP